MAITQRKQKIELPYSFHRRVGKPGQGLELAAMEAQGGERERGVVKEFIRAQ